MSEAPPRRSGRFGGIFVAVVTAGSAVGVIGWYLKTNQTGPSIDTSGFDLSAAPQTPKPHPLLPNSAAPAQPDSLSMMKGDSGVRIVDANAPATRNAPAGTAAKEQSRLNFTEQARKHEADVRWFAERMTKKYPLIRQYGKDWMSHPDLRSLTNNYWRNRDPMAFIAGLSKAPSVGAMVKRYAGAPEILDFVTEGMKEAPSELTSSALDVLSNDGVVRNLVANVANGLGLPPSVTSMIAGSGGPSKPDSKRAVNDMMMKNSAAKDALQQQDPQPAPVPLNQP